ncbi:septation protein SepH [Nocardioides sp. R1-1]|uniref:septation protein SepH n=1 Tax=Nocardioides sp. R1-1 TaxID=3383502 RepID=UPI0038D20322
MTDTADQGGTTRPVRLTLSPDQSPGADRRRLLLVDDEGAEFTLDITPDLRAAVRGETPRRLETSMSSSIRPREIQTRIRAGESAEAVAEAAGTSVEAIMSYVAPVLAEREHVATRAQRASVRRTPGEGQPAAAGSAQARVLGDAVAAHLRGRGADPASVTWDAYRRETGRWVLTGTFETAERSGVARFTYDAPGNYVLSDNDDARWLVGEALPPAAPARDDLQQVRERRLSAVPEELPLGGSAPAAETTGAEVTAGADPRLDVPLDLPLDAPAQAAGTPEEPAEEGPEETAEEKAAAEAERARHRRPVQKKRGRASVPSWDEIMFGGGDQ